MRYLSVCSGIAADAVAWHPLGWECAAFSEIDSKAYAVLDHHYPDTPIHDDFTTIKENEYGPIDLLIGGTPCQSFSAAGRRGGLDDPRGNLSLEFCNLASRIGARWFVWENVTGAMYRDEGRAFGNIIRKMVECGYGVFWRVLDTQYIRTQSFPHAIPQRRRRVFVVGHIGDWRPPAAVLLERETLQRNPAPCRRTGTRSSALTASGVGTCGADDNQAQANHLVVYKEAQATSFHIQNSNTDAKLGERDLAVTLVSRANGVTSEDNTYVRRLTPIECERLQGFPDNYTAVPYGQKILSDPARYALLGNAMSVNVIEWIGRRIQMVEDILQSTR